MDTVSRTAHGGPENSEPDDVMFIRFRVTAEVWERLNITKVKRRSSIQQICSDALAKWLEDPENAAY